MNLTFIPSPNFDSNRVKIDTIFIHWIVGNLASADAVFKKPGGTSAHYAVEDENVHQYVKEDKVAYHAGVYSWNQRSIGIEHSADPNRPASDKTYAISAKLIAEICKRHGIPLDRQHIKGHKEVKATQCPGTMDIDRLIQLAKQSIPVPVDMQTELDKVRAERDKNWNLYQTEIKNRQVEVSNLKNKLAEIFKIAKP